ncbi:54S ribosomal mitochondrial [Micractinium conductrix]|uniref:Large ribosomal subunit protein bL28m n=1 Tax=Micractinium conductrix TaxID=554055 RepID=A0A2P6VH29_9CHLO|nr:54S ribosomal mitochondrial [Micractinium conductrix]|eukprot:PSC73390.1 54S ribosomal mitochondrial [Micractinium conductrix]
MPLGFASLTRAVCNRARRGLYAGRRVLSGNQISDDGGNKSRRVWKPNSHNKRLYSHVLQRMVQLRVTAAALRDIDKVGGIDAYILNTPDKKLQSDVALDLRGEMVEALLKESVRVHAAEQQQAAQPQRQQQRRRRQQQAAQLGLSPAAAAAVEAAPL